jgi:hypothetical protein
METALDLFHHNKDSQQTKEVVLFKATSFVLWLIPQVELDLRVNLYRYHHFFIKNK